MTVSERAEWEEVTGAVYRDYRIVLKTTIRELEADVRDLMNLGWEPLGGLAVVVIEGEPHVAQALAGATATRPQEHLPGTPRRCGGRLGCQVPVPRDGELCYDCYMARKSAQPTGTSDPTPSPETPSDPSDRPEP